MTYWQARALQNIAYAGEYKRIAQSSAWQPVFGNPFRYTVIDNSRMQCFVRNGWVVEEPMQTHPFDVMRVTPKGFHAFNKYLARYHKMRVKSWAKIMEVEPK